MKIELEIPDFPGIEQRAVFVFLGIDCHAEKYPGKPWRIKTALCNQCGKCCQRLAIDNQFPPIKDGVCGFLETKGEHVRCSLGVNRPFNCAISHPVMDECCLKFDEV